MLSRWSLEVTTTDHLVIVIVVEELTSRMMSCRHLHLLALRFLSNGHRKSTCVKVALE